MRKAITPVISIIVLLLITIALVGGGWVYISGYFETMMKVIDIPPGSAYCRGNEATLVIRNPGQSVINNSDRKAMLGLFHDHEDAVGAWRFEGDGNATGDSSPNSNTGSIYGDTVLLMHFDEGSGNITNDETSYDNNGNMTNHEPEWKSSGCQSGSCLEFDGVNDYVDIGNIGNIKTISYWIKANSDDEYVMDLDGGTHYIEHNSYPVGFTDATVYVDGVQETTLGSELVTNGDFSAWDSDNPVDWGVAEDPTGEEISEVGSGQGHGGTGTGYCNIYRVGRDYVAVGQTMTVVAGRKYQVSVKVDRIVRGGAQVSARPEFPSQPLESEGTHTFTFVAIDTSVGIVITPKAGQACDVTFDDVSVKQVSDLVSSNQWYHVVITTNTAINADSVTLGKYSSNYFNGTIDEVAIYSRSLTADEVNDLYEAGRAKFIERKLGRFGYALGFDGDGDYVFVADNAGVTNFGAGDSYSLSLWFKSSVKASQSVTEHWESLSGGYPWAIRGPRTGDGRVSFAIYDGPVLLHNPSIRPAKDYSDGKWHHLIAIRDVAADEISLYIDSELFGPVTDTTTGSIQSTNNGFTIGNRESSSGSSRYFNGTIDEVVILNEALTPEQITAQLTPACSCSGNTCKCGDLTITRTEGEGYFHPYFDSETISPKGSVRMTDYSCMSGSCTYRITSPAASVEATVECS